MRAEELILTAVFLLIIAAIVISAALSLEKSGEIRCAECGHEMIREGTVDGIAYYECPECGKEIIIIETKEIGNA